MRDIAGLGHLRAHLRQQLRAHGVTGEIISDVTVAACELATNGLLHGGAPAVTVSSTTTPGQVDLCVHHADGYRSRHHPVTANHLDAGGRGLDIVTGLSNSMSVEETFGWRSTRLEFTHVATTRSVPSVTPDDASGLVERVAVCA